MPETIVLVPPDTLTCDHCGAETDETFTTTGNEEICESCRDEYTACDRCGQYVTNDDALCETTGGDYVCQGCAEWYYSECDRCERVARYTCSTVHGYSICDDCAEMSYWRCESCDEYVSDDYIECPDCPTGSNLIHDYGYKPYPQFHGDGPLYLGVELEVSVPSYRISEAAELADSHLGGLGYLKEDGSVDGFEIVTHPMSHAYAAESFPWRMLRELEHLGASGDDAGLHVHVSRAAFDGPAHVYRWLKLLYRNSDAVSQIARRDSNEWAAWSDNDRMRAKDYAKGGRIGRRYSAVNVQNDETFEVRVFASTLDTSELRAAIDLVAGSVEYSRSLTVADITRGDGWTWDAFIKWADERPEYAALVEMAREEW